MPDAQLQLEGYQVGDLLAQVVTDLKYSMPVGVTGTIDVQLEFNSLTVSEKGLSIIYVNKASTQSSMSIKLGTRVYMDGPTVSNETLVRFIQKSLQEEQLYDGPLDGQMSNRLRAAIDRAIAQAPPQSDLGLIKAKLKDQDAKKTAYLQHALNKQLVLKITVDGDDGPETRKALYTLFGDYSVVKKSLSGWVT